MVEWGKIGSIHSFSEVIWYTREEFAAAGLADVFAIAHSDFATDRHSRGAAFDLSFLKRIVIEVHVMGTGGDGSAIIGVIDDEVGIGAGLNGALAGEEAEKFGGLSAGGGNKLVQIDPAAFHAFGVVEIDPIFQGRDAIGDFREIAPAHLLL